MQILQLHVWLTHVENTADTLAVPFRVAAE